MVNGNPGYSQEKFDRIPKRTALKTGLKGGECMKTMEIYFRDLNDEAQERFADTFGRPEDMNVDLFPLAVVEIEDSDEEVE
jgi:hypothetical protein